jgi:hypothetical protein
VSGIILKITSLRKKTGSLEYIGFFSFVIIIIMVGLSAWQAFQPYIEFGL